MAAKFHVLGTIEAFDGGRAVDLGHSRQRAVLAVLLVHANRPVPADQLLDHVWGERLPHRGRDALYSYVSRLRSALAGLPAVSLRRRSAGYVLGVEEASVDLHRFRRLAAQARASADADGALALFDEALDLWQGTVFADLDSPWFTSTRIALETERRAAELDRVDAALCAGRHAELVADLTVHAERYPLDERLAGQMMLTLYRAGRTADALEYYQRLRKELAEQLGTDPGPPLQELHHRILIDHPALVAPTPTRPSARTQTPYVTPRHLPPAPAGFTGRTDELATLTAALDDTLANSNSNTVLISSLAGAGGIGKTWLALHWARQHLSRFPDGQLFVDLRGFSPDGDPLDPLTAVRGFLDALGVDASHLDGGLDEHTARYRSHIADKRMLILLDNAACADQITPLLPGTASCTVLVTSRNVLTPLLTRYGAHHLSLDVLSDGEAHALLTGRLGHARVAAEPDAAAELIGLCGRYPLALGIVAARAIARPEIPLTDFAAELRQIGLPALSDAEPTASLPAVLSWSLHGLTAEQRTAFALLGIAPGSDIALPAAASLTGLPQPRARALLRELTDASLLLRRPGGRYAMHDLIRAYAADTATTHLGEQSHESALQRVLDFYTHAAHAADRLLDPHRPSLDGLDSPVPDVHPDFLPDPPAALAWFDAEHANLLAAQRTATGRHHYSVVWQLAWTLYTFHYRRGHRHDRLAVWHAARDAAAHLPDPAVHTLVHRFLGGAYSAMENFEEAITHLGQAIALAEKHHDIHQQAHSHYLLTLVWGRQGDDRQALEHAIPALRLFRALGRAVWEASALNDLGWYKAQFGDYDAARDHCQAALALQRQHHDPGGEAATLDSLGYIEHHTGHHQRAIGHYRQAVTLFRAIGSTYEAADTLDSLGLPHVALGQHEQARAAWREALTLYREQGRNSHADRIQHQLDELNNSLAGR